MTADPTRPMDAAAVSLHEMFSSLLRAGFSESHAVAIVATALVAQINKGGAK